MYKWVQIYCEACHSTDHVTVRTMSMWNMPRTYRIRSFICMHIWLCTIQTMSSANHVTVRTMSLRNAYSQYTFEFEYIKIYLYVHVCMHMNVCVWICVTDWSDGHGRRRDGQARHGLESTLAYYSRPQWQQWQLLRLVYLACSRCALGVFIVEARNGLEWALTHYSGPQWQQRQLSDWCVLGVSTGEVRHELKRDLAYYPERTWQHWHLLRQAWSKRVAIWYSGSQWQ